MGSSKPILAPTVAAKRILIVDDLPQIRKLIRDYLEEEMDFRVCGEAIDGLTPSIKPKI